MKGKITIMYAIIGVLGLIYLICAVVVLYNWAVSALALKIEPIHLVLGVFVPSDPGSAIVFMTASMLLFGSIYYRYDEYKYTSCLLVGSLLGTALLVLQLLILLANIGDAFVLTLYGEVAEYNIMEDVLRPEILLGLISAVIFHNSLKSLKRLTMRPEKNI